MDIFINYIVYEIPAPMLSILGALFAFLGGILLAIGNIPFQLKITRIVDYIEAELYSHSDNLGTTSKLKTSTIATVEKGSGIGVEIKETTSQNTFDILHYFGFQKGLKESLVKCSKLARYGFIFLVGSFVYQCISILVLILNN